MNLGHNEDEELDVRKYLKEFKEALLNQNSKLLISKFNLPLEELCHSQMMPMFRGDHIFRARLYMEEDRFDKFFKKKIVNGPFKGFDKENSFVNQTKIKPSGRANLMGVSYLYASLDKKTAALEVAHQKGVTVSVADIEITESLKILDLSRKWVSSNYNAELILCLSNEMNTPVDSSNKYANDYILTQYLCNYAKNNGFDGVLYNAIIHHKNTDGSITYEKENSDIEGKNIVIFNYEKCKAISSDLYLIKNIDMDFDMFT